MNILVTGGCGFIGSNFIRQTAYWALDTVTNLDALTYAATDDFRDIIKDGRSNHGKNYTLVAGRVENQEDVEAAFANAFAYHDYINVLINFAAESHVDRSLQDVTPFLQTNVLGPHNLLSVAAKYKDDIVLIIHVSTDEVYGDIANMPDGTEMREGNQLNPGNPYAASKAAGEMLARGVANVEGLPLCIVRPCNNFGPRQHPEKLIPMCVINALEDKPITIYGDGKQVREWIHVTDTCNSLLIVSDYMDQNPKHSNVWNIGSGRSYTNLEIVKKILDILGKPHSLITHVQDRRAHDRKYAIDSSLINSEEPRLLGDFDKQLEETVMWYVTNEDWWRKIQRSRFNTYYK